MEEVSKTLINYWGHFVPLQVSTSRLLAEPQFMEKIGCEFKSLFWHLTVDVNYTVNIVWGKIH